METPNLDRFLDTAKPLMPLTHDLSRSELSALKQRVEDLELMLRSEWRDGWKWFRIMDDGGWTLGHRETGWDTRGQPVCKDDGTGLPLLTAEAREALKGGR